jgi:dynein heavy chain
LVIEKESKEANEIKAVATIDEENASKVAAEVKGISDQANAKLAEAEPALEKAVRAVKEIKVADFFEMKTVNTPGPSIVTCFKMLCLFLTNLVQG